MSEVLQHELGDAMSGVLQHESSFDVRGVRYRYLIWTGACRSLPPVILLHGFSQSADSWDQVAPLLACHRTVYALDLVGHGGSAAPADSFSYALQAQGEALLSFAAHAAAENGGRRPAVIGYSMGGRIALSSLVGQPEAFSRTVSSLVLESAGLGFATDADRACAADRDAANASRLREQGLKAFMDAWERLPLFASQRRLPPNVRSHVRAGRLANDAEALARTFEHAGQHSMPTRKEVLSALDAVCDQGVSVQYLTGSLDRKYCALSEELRCVSDVAVEVVQGSGHNVHLEAPADFVRCVEAFLAPAPLRPRA